MSISFEISYKTSKELIQVPTTGTYGDLCQAVAKTFNMVSSSVKIVGLTTGKFLPPETVLSTLPKVQKEMSAVTPGIVKLRALGVVEGELTELHERESQYIAAKEAAERQTMLTHLRMERASLVPVRAQMERELRQSRLLPRLEAAWQTDRGGLALGGPMSPIPIHIPLTTFDFDVNTGYIPPPPVGGAEERLIPELMALGAQVWAVAKTRELTLHAQEQLLLSGGSPAEVPKLKVNVAETEAAAAGGDMAVSVWEGEKRRKLHEHSQWVRMQQDHRRMLAESQIREERRLSDFLHKGAVTVLDKRVWCRLRVQLTTDNTVTGVGVPTDVLNVMVPNGVPFPLALAIHSIERRTSDVANTTGRLGDAIQRTDAIQRVDAVHESIGRILQVDTFHNHTVANDSNGAGMTGNGTGYSEDMAQRRPTQDEEQLIEVGRMLRQTNVVYHTSIAYHSLLVCYFTYIIFISNNSISYHS